MAKITDAGAFLCAKRLALWGVLLSLVIVPTAGALTGVGFLGDWETGNISQWTWGAQCANYTTPPPGSGTVGKLYIVTSPVAQGKYSGRFDLPAYGSNNSCEVLRKRTLGYDDWYAQEIYFPSNWREPSAWGLELGQYDFQGITGPPVGLYAHAKYVYLGIETGWCYPSGGCQYQGKPRIIPTEINLAGTWQKFVVHIKHAADSTGLVEGWWRTHDQWTQTVTWKGVTIQRSGSAYPGPNTITADKIGAYRGAASFPITVWQDGFCVATSFSTAVSCL